MGFLFLIGLVYLFSFVGTRGHFKLCRYFVYFLGLVASNIPEFFSPFILRLLAF